jgi:hypothetical protein
MAARTTGQSWQLAECLLPGLTLPAAEALAQRIQAELAGQPHCGVVFLGAVLMPGDEVLLCLFSGSPAAVRAVSDQAGLPYERILGSTATPAAGQPGSCSG